MLLSFRAVNHRSIRDEQHLNLAPVYDADRPPGTKWPAVPVAAIYGANASGKSNLLDAFCYLQTMVLRSDQEAEPGLGVRRFPFALDPEVGAEPSSFDIDVTIDGTHHSYGFSVDDDRVVEEWLYRYPNKRRQVVFFRDGQDFRFGTTARPDLREAVGITARNALFASVAARAGKDDVFPLYAWLRSTPAGPSRSFGRTRQSRQLPLLMRLERLLLSESHRQAVLGLLRAVDFGIEDVRVDYLEFDDWPEAEKKSWREYQATRVEDEPEPTRAPRQRRTVFEMHGAKPGATLQLGDQSDGTRVFLERITVVLDVLRSGSLMLIDELESNLHPNLAGQIVRLFQDASTNPHGAQLVFTTHDTSLLGSNAEVLKRDQIWFVEKEYSSGASRLFPLTDFKPRDNENTERRYRSGSYRAVPFIDEEVALSAVQRFLDEREASGRDDG